MTNQFFKGAFIAYATVIFNIIAGLVYTPYVISSVGQGDYGLFVLATTFLSYFLIDFGLGNSVAKFISERKYNKSDYTEQELISVIFRMFILISIIVGIVLCICYVFVDNIFLGLSADEAIKFKNIFLVLGVFGLSAFIFTPLNGILIANQQFVFLKSTDFVSKLLKIILTIIFFVFDISIYSLVFANMISDGLVLILKIVFCTRHGVLKIDLKYKNKKLVKEVLNFSSWMMVVTFAQRFIIPITPTILGIFSNSDQIAIFAIATTIEGYVFTFAQAINGLFLPKVTQMNSSENREEINKLAISVGRIQLFIIGFILSAIVVFGKDFIILWVGESFASAYYIILLIALPNIIVLTQEIFYTVLIVENKIKERAIVFSVGAIISTLVSVVLSQLYGAIGSAIGIAICLYGSHIVGMNYVYKVHLKLDIKSFFKKCHLKILPFIISYIILWLFIKTFVVISGWKSIFMCGTIYAIIYCLVLLLFCINSKEKDLMKEVLKRR